MSEVPPPNGAKMLTQLLNPLFKNAVSDGVKLVIDEVKHNTNEIAELMIQLDTLTDQLSKLTALVQIQHKVIVDMRDHIYKDSSLKESNENNQLLNSPKSLQKTVLVMDNGPSINMFKIAEEVDIDFD